MERVYSDGFILDCANPLESSSNETLQHIQNRLSNRQLQIGIFEADYWIGKIRELRSGNQIDQFIYNKVMDWFSANRLQKLYFDSGRLPENDDALLSAIWLESEEDEQNLFDYLEQRKLLSLIKDEIFANHYRWLFKITELPTISYDSHFRWSNYLIPYAHFTDKIYIWDRYFLYNWRSFISDLIGPFLEMNPDLEVEIISELDQSNMSYKYGIKNVHRLKDESGDRIRFYKPNPGIGERYHDRYLMTSYCLLKSEPGFNIIKYQKKSFRETTPTLIGRYAEGNHKWKSEMESWEKRKNEACEAILL